MAYFPNGCREAIYSINDSEKYFLAAYILPAKPPSVIPPAICAYVFNEVVKTEKATFKVAFSDSKEYALFNAFYIIARTGINLDLVTLVNKQRHFNFDTVFGSGGF